jgi:hypothetical protein
MLFVAIALSASSRLLSISRSVSRMKITAKRNPANTS